MAQEKIRLDDLLLELGFFESKEKARTCIMMNGVNLGGKLANKAGKQINKQSFYQAYDEDPNYLEVSNKLMPYVGRGALKLKTAFADFKLDCRDFVCLDIGASTGGFTDFLLQNGAARVVAIDVGKNQLAFKLREDKRVLSIEGQNFREFDDSCLKEKLIVDFVVADLSFISIVLILEKLKQLIIKPGPKLSFKPDCKFVILLKPQFEAGKQIVDKCKGVISDDKIREEVKNSTIAKIEQLGFRLACQCESAIKGAKGNQEYLLLLEFSCEDSGIL